MENYTVRPLRALTGFNGPDQPFSGPPHSLLGSPNSAQSWAFSPYLSYAIGVLDSSSVTAVLCHGSRPWPATWFPSLTLILPHHYGPTQWSLSDWLLSSVMQIDFLAWSWTCLITMKFLDFSWTCLPSLSLYCSPCSGTVRSLASKAPALLAFLSHLTPHPSGSKCPSLHPDICVYNFSLNTLFQTFLKDFSQTKPSFLRIWILYKGDKLRVPLFQLGNFPPHTVGIFSAIILGPVVSRILSLFQLKFVHLLLNLYTSLSLLLLFFYKKLKFHIPLSSQFLK